MTHPNHSAKQWPTEVFLLQAADREGLRRRVAELSAYLAAQPNCDLAELAASLNRVPPTQPETTHGASSPQGPQRLALVAGTVAELRQRLERAESKLADAGVRQIRDSLGLYYTEQPLGGPGRVAFLFPGEGAPYLGMLGDLRPHFPEVAAVVDKCDQLQSESEHDNRPLSRFLSVPSDPTEKAALEADLGGLGNTMFSVLMADWALLELLTKLDLRPDAMGGHSVGELAALWVGGGFGHDPDLRVVHESMQSLEQDESAGNTDTVLLAIGASREAMEELIGRVAPSAIRVAMDNCPHQTILAGPTAAMVQLEAELIARKIMHERLPFNRPYHTPLFEPFMGPLTRMFADIPFQTPRVRLYSNKTAAPYPGDAMAVRELALSQWKSPVEFTRMVRQMHDDGIRIFIEVGPRGNLTAFVEDTLRGRDFLAVPVDTPRRQGRTQLHHLVAQLAAHHVSLNLDHLYTRRANAATPPVVSQLVSQRHAATQSYFGVMDQFLGVQQDVMQSYLQSRRRGRVGRVRVRGHVGRVAGPSAPAELGRAGDPSYENENVAPSAPPVTNLPMIGKIAGYTPGTEIVVRRVLDLEEDIYGAHHTVGGREVSYVHPERNGQPVTPMTFSLELMAEAATLLVPDQVVTAIQNVQLLKWLAFDEDEPVTVELTGKVIAHSAEAAELQMHIRDLGHEPADGEAGALAAVATVRMQDRYPEPPPVQDFPLTGERPCRIPLDVLYKNLFHGEYFQGVRSLDRFGEEGIQGQCRVLPRDGLFKSNPDPQFVLDPVFMDIVMHPLAGWHLEQPDQSGRILLPFELKDIRFYGPRPAVGTEMTSQGRIVHESGRRFTHSVDVVGPDGRYWCQMHDLKYWRFYLPFGEFNFHGPKDDYFLSDNWPAPVGDAMDDKTPSAWCVRLEPPRDLQQPGLMMASGRVTLTQDELVQFRRLEVPAAKKIDWLFGRMAAKDAVRLLWRSRTGERMVPADIAIEPDESGRPVARPLGQERPADFPHVSISHIAGLVVAAASFDRPVGIDVEPVVARDPSFEAAAFNEHERELLDRCEDRAEAVTRFWCAKEAASKALGRGLVDGPRSLSVQGWDSATGMVEVVIGATLAEMFPELREVPLAVRTLREDDLVVATCFLEGVPACT